jgi:hypothetical protein
MGRGTQAPGPTTKPILPLPARPAPLRRALYASQQTAGETLGIAAQMERAERFGHRFRPDEPLPASEVDPAPPGPAPAGSPAAEATAPIQRVRSMSLRSRTAPHPFDASVDPAVSIAKDD